jgi:hypothetical protein
MLQQLTNLLSSHNHMLPVSYRTASGKTWQPSTLVAADSTGLMFVDSRKNTTIVPWSNIAGVHIKN